MTLRVRRDNPEQELESLPRLKKPIRIVINGQDFPSSMYLKNESGLPVPSAKASKDLYRIAQKISDKIRFLPVEGVGIEIEHYDRNKLKDYSSLIDVCLKVLYRACLIECMTSTSVEKVSVKHIKADRAKVAIQIEPIGLKQKLEPSEGQLTL